MSMTPGEWEIIVSKPEWIWVKGEEYAIGYFANPADAQAATALKDLIALAEECVSAPYSSQSPHLTINGLAMKAEAALAKAGIEEKK